MAKATELWAGRADALAVAGDRALVAAAEDWACLVYAQTARLLVRHNCRPGTPLTTPAELRLPSGLVALGLHDHVAGALLASGAVMIWPTNADAETVATQCAADSGSLVWRGDAFVAVAGGRYAVVQPAPLEVLAEGVLEECEGEVQGAAWTSGEGLTVFLPDRAVAFDPDFSVRSVAVRSSRSSAMLGPGLSVEASSAKELVARKLDLNLIVSRVALPADARLVACSGDVVVAATEKAVLRTAMPRTEMTLSSLL